MENYSTAIPQEVFKEMFNGPMPYVQLDHRISEKSRGKKSVAKVELDRVRSFLDAMGYYHMSGQAEVALSCFGSKLIWTRDSGLTATITPAGLKLQGESLSRLIAAMQASDEVDLFPADDEAVIRCHKHYDLRSTLYESLTDTTRKADRKNGVVRTEEEYEEICRDNEDTLSIWITRKYLTDNLIELGMLTGVSLWRIPDILHRLGYKVGTEDD